MITDEGKLIHSFLPWLCNSGAIPEETKSVLDIGCGRGVTGAILSIIRPIERLVGIDVHKPYLNAVRSVGRYDSLICMDFSKEPLPFSVEPFDIVLLLEVIEHLRKEDGLRLLGEAEALGQVILSTPRGPFSQGPYDNNPFQEHLSAWTERDFAPRGYVVWYVVRGGSSTKVEIITRSKIAALVVSKLMRGMIQILAIKPRRGR